MAARDCMPQEAAILPLLFLDDGKKHLSSLGKQAQEGGEWLCSTFDQA